MNFIYTLFRHRAIIQRLQDELAKPFDVRLKEFKETLLGAELSIQSPVITIMASSMIDLYRSFDGANNYLTLNFSDPKTGEVFEFIVQRKNGKTPSDIVSEQKVQINIMASYLNDYADNIGHKNSISEFLTLKGLRK